MTVRSELKKIVDLDTYEEDKREDGSLFVYVRKDDLTGAELLFDAETVKNLKQAELAKLIAEHLGETK